MIRSERTKFQQKTLFDTLLTIRQNGAVRMRRITKINVEDFQPSGSAQSRHTYTVRRLDGETELYYYRHRTYAAQLGRFCSRDPVGYAGGNFLYSYCSDSPLRHKDPSGLSPACTSLDAIFFVHGGPQDISAPYSEGTVCASILVIPGTCPGELIEISIRYSTYDPIRNEPDPTAIEEMKTKFKGWTYSLPTGCVVKGGEVKVGYKDHPEVNWTITCATDCARSPDNKGKVCEDSSGSASIAPNTVGDVFETLVVQWKVSFTDKCCTTVGCQTHIELGQTAPGPGGQGPPGRPKVGIDEIDRPADPPCPNKY